MRARHPCPPEPGRTALQELRACGGFRRARVPGVDVRQHHLHRLLRLLADLCQAAGLFDHSDRPKAPAIPELSGPPTRALVKARLRSLFPGVKEGGTGGMSPSWSAGDRLQLRRMTLEAPLLCSLQDRVVGARQSTSTTAIRERGPHASGSGPALSDKQIGCVDRLVPRAGESRFIGHFFSAAIQGSRACRHLGGGMGRFLPYGDAIVVSPARVGTADLLEGLPEEPLDRPDEVNINNRRRCRPSSSACSVVAVSSTFWAPRSAPWWRTGFYPDRRFHHLIPAARRSSRCRRDTRGLCGWRVPDAEIAHHVCPCHAGP